MAKFVYFFGGGKADGNGSMKNLLGGKGANLAEMAGHKALKLPVPPGFTITTEVCTYYYDNKKKYLFFDDCFIIRISALFAKAVF